MNRLILVLLLCFCAHPALADEARPGDGLFQTDRLWTIHIRINSRQWEMMQPTRAPRLAVLLGLTQDGPDDDDDDQLYVEGQRLTPCPFGYEYAYVRGTVEFDGEVIEDVGVRFKGNYSYQQYADTLKRPLKLDFNRFVKGQKFQGVSTINLGNNALDPSHLREALAYELFRAAGIPTPRTSFAMVYLTVEGQHDRKLVGLYTIVEQVNKTFLKTHYDTAKGLLLKPENIRDLPYLGEEFDAYCRYGAKLNPVPQHARRFIDFLRLLHLSDEATFQSAIESYLAIDQFLRFIAVHAFIINMDSFLGGHHNYYMYLHPEDGRVYFMPWDQNFAFGDTGGQNLSIDAPMSRSNTLIERVLLNTAHREVYHHHLRTMMQTFFQPDRLVARIEEMEAVVRKAEEIATAQGVDLHPRPPRKSTDLKTFVRSRAESVIGQLNAEVTGFVPGQPRPRPQASIFPRRAAPTRGMVRPTPPRMSPPPAPTPPPQRPTPSSIPATFTRAADVDRNGTISREELAATVTVFFRAVAGDRNGSLDAPALADALDRMAVLLEMGMVEPAAASEPRPAKAWARIIMDEVGGDSQERVTLPELLEIAQRWFAEADADKNGQLTTKEVTDWLPTRTK